MVQSQSRDSLKKLEVALERGGRPSRAHGILMLFWGLIYAKLFLLEYGVQVYEVPLNSLLYLWTLTLIMGIVCTIAYVRLFPGARKEESMTDKALWNIWVGCFIAVGLGAVSSLLTSPMNAFQAPAFSSLIMGVGFMSQSALGGKRLYFHLALTWWVIAVILFHQEGVITFAWFSLSLVLFHVIPTAYLHFFRHRKKAAASPSMD